MTNSGEARLRSRRRVPAGLAIVLIVLVPFGGAGFALAVSGTFIPKPWQLPPPAAVVQMRSVMGQQTRQETALILKAQAAHDTATLAAIPEMQQLANGSTLQVEFPNGRDDFTAEFNVSSSFKYPDEDAAVYEEDSEFYTCSYDSANGGYYAQSQPLTNPDNSISTTC